MDEKGGIRVAIFVDIRIFIRIRLGCARLTEGTGPRKHGTVLRNGGWRTVALFTAGRRCMYFGGDHRVNPETNRS